jgi:hypothetical protein
MGVDNEGKKAKEPREEAGAQRKSDDRLVPADPIEDYLCAPFGLQRLGFEGHISKKLFPINSNIGGRVEYVSADKPGTDNAHFDAQIGSLCPQGRGEPYKRVLGGSVRSSIR